MQVLGTVTLDYSPASHRLKHNTALSLRGFHSQRTFWKQVPKDFSVTPLSRLQRPGSGASHHGDHRSIRCLLSCKLSGFLCGPSGAGPFPRESLLQPRPKHSSELSGAERAEMGPGNTSWPTHIPGFWLGHLALSISLGLKTCQPIHMIMMTFWWHNICQSAQHMVVVKIENLKYKLLNFQLRTHRFSSRHSLNGPPTSWPAGRVVPHLRPGWPKVPTPTEGCRLAGCCPGYHSCQGRPEYTRGPAIPIQVHLSQWISTWSSVMSTRVVWVPIQSPQGAPHWPLREISPKGDCMELSISRAQKHKALRVGCLKSRRCSTQFFESLLVLTPSGETNRQSWMNRTCNLS